MGRLGAATVFWLMAAITVGEKLPGEISGRLGDPAKAGDSGGGKLISRDTPCNGVTVSLEGKVKAVEMEEFNISLIVFSSSSSAASR